MVDPNFEKQRDEYLNNEVAKPDNQRFGNWVSKLVAAKAAGIARPTLDVWITNGTIPETAVRQERKGKKTVYLLDEGEVTRIAKERIQNRPAQQKVEQNLQETNRSTALKVLETERDGLKEQVKSLEAQVLRIEDQTTKLSEAKDAALTVAKDSAKYTATLLANQLEEAKAEAKEARGTAKKATDDLLAEKSKGFFKKLFGS